MLEALSTVAQVSGTYVVHVITDGLQKVELVVLFEVPRLPALLHNNSHTCTEKRSIPKLIRKRIEFITQDIVQNKYADPVLVALLYTFKSLAYEFV